MWYCLSQKGGLSIKKDNIVKTSSPKRSHYCGSLNASQDGQTVTLMGWVNTRRDHGGLIFVDLRDREGYVQVVLNPNESLMSSAKDFRNEFVVSITGLVQKRPEGMVNKKISTGEIEVVAQSCEVLSEAQTPPFAIDDDKVGENLRLKYRYLDLRTSKLQKNLILRHQTVLEARKKLAELGFIEVETPILYKSTPEGARDYLVPSRVHLGHFYALPQSPQTLKQLLMVGGMDKYFQICRCFRDEDLRADRQPEFSQIDMEMSFVDQEDVIRVNEELARHLWKTIKNEDIGEVPHITYKEAMDKYGVDRPDLRIPLEIRPLAEIVRGAGFKVFDDALSSGGDVRALAVPKAGGYSRGQMDKLTQLAKQMGAKGLVWIKASESGELSSPVQKFFTPERLTEIFQSVGGENGGAVFVIADEYKICCAALGALRSQLAKELQLIDTTKDRFCWVVDFPLLDFDPEEKRYVACHHPFTSPQNQHFEDLKTGQNLGEITAKAYDFVCNGYELGGGSIRIHRNEIQKAMFKALGFSEEEVQHRFGFFVEALQYGTPPHGGFAWGLDRLIMILVGSEAIRDVIAFPKTTKASDMMADTPSTVDNAQLLELGIRCQTPG